MKTGRGNKFTAGAGKLSKNKKVLPEIQRLRVMQRAKNEQTF
jgi:hypothetical protein